MSDEERKALYYISLRRKGIPPNGSFIIDNEEITIILNLIEKQSKEIEELKKYEKYYEEMEEVNKKFISVDKIKAKIEEYKKDGKIINQTMPYCGEYKNHFEIKALQSLLEKE